MHTNDFMSLCVNVDTSAVTNVPCREDTDNERGYDPLEEEMAAHSNIPAWRIPWTEEPGGLQSMGLQRVGACTRAQARYTPGYTNYRCGWSSKN